MALTLNDLFFEGTKKSPFGTVAFDNFLFRRKSDYRVYISLSTAVFSVNPG